jgi:predicted nucleic acid-binding protein
MTLYLDTSALVKLYVEEPGSFQMRQLLEAAARVGTSRITYVEARAALARRHREHLLATGPYRTVLNSLEQEWQTYVLLDVTWPILRDAGTLAERHALKAYDALHLATALAFRRGGALQLVAADHQLLLAAGKEGLRTRALLA